MCRLFGSRSLEPDGAARELLRTGNALRVQSLAHPDGWGLGWYEADGPHTIRSVAPAHSDELFETHGDLVHSPALVAHVRKASVGGISLVNTHPFQVGRWLFVHNGTVPSWDACRPLLEAQLEPSLLRALRGETDSERCAALFVTLLADRCDPNDCRFDDAAAALRETVARVRAAAETGSHEEASTTFLLTDGRSMLACRRGRTLHSCAPPPDEHGRVPWFAISSEDPHAAGCAGGARRPWLPLAEDSWMGVDPDLRLHHGRL